jgi:hypothetical protein
MWVRLRVTGIPSVVGPLGLGCAPLAVVLVAVVVAGLRSGAYLQLLLLLSVAVLVVALAMSHILPVYIWISPVGVRAGARWIPRHEFQRCEVEDHGPYRLRLVLRTVRGNWRSRELLEPRARVERVAATITAALSRDEASSRCSPRA